MQQTSKLLAPLCIALRLQAADPSLTIYNQGFAVIRELIPVEWKAGLSELSHSGVTIYVDPRSVILKDQQDSFQILEQNYRNDPVSMQRLLSLYEGQTIPFQQGTRIIQGKIIRGGYQPVVEADGRLTFGLPGQPMFPSLRSDAILKPTLTWLVKAANPGKAQAELSYVSEGISWSAAYNVIAGRADQKVDILGWVTMENHTGSSFENARLQLMAGDVNKLPPQRFERLQQFAIDGPAEKDSRPLVTERAFDEYHLYTLDNRVTLRDKETKQAEFLRAGSIASQQIYVYDGMFLNSEMYRSWTYELIRSDQSYGTQSNPNVWVMREIENTKDNHLGIALPTGKVRFYRSDTEGRLQFTGEDNIPHSPQGEKLRLYTGNAFDIVGQRIQTGYKTDHARRSTEETIEVRLRNHKETSVEVRVVEHLNRGANWTIQEPSDTFNKIDSKTIEFRVNIKPGQEHIITYQAHYKF